ncbi:FliI/YscN family ATPase [uncultured Planktomarina sp.]|uniref:FliI/YscN family ATPase n=1 Tax=uncultured Planktomarina sp. TaxID=1538529 RepID=UPI003260A55D
MSINAVSILSRRIEKIATSPLLVASGRVTQFDGQIIECDGFPVSVGSICHVRGPGGNVINAEIIGFRAGKNIAFLYEQNADIEVGALVTVANNGRLVDVGDALLGRVIDAHGHPFDGLGPLKLDQTWPLYGNSVNPLDRAPISQPLDVGVRSVNALLTIGKGQRVGIVAGSGVGKSILLSMMTRFSKADVIVVGLIGERGREVGAFVEQAMTAAARHKICVVAVPADRAALLRIRGANRATSIAEYFRSKGKDVLLIMDSLTRVAHAKREVGLAMGEQPTAKGYPPSVVSMIPNLIERTGTGAIGEGAITSIYTVLADGDDTTNDPVVDTARAILDGHIVLSRKQTQLGIYPAIDLTASVSRVMNEITDARHQRAAQKFKRLIYLYMENRDLMLMGGYAAGQDPELDLAIALWPKITAYVAQAANEPADYTDSKDALIALMAE